MLGCPDGGATSAEKSWLQSDLAANRSACVLATWHHPLFSYGWTLGTPGRWQPLWSTLYSAHADVVLNGHDHLYERYAPTGSLRHRDHERHSGVRGGDRRREPERAQRDTRQPFRQSAS